MGVGDGPRAVGYCRRSTDRQEQSIPDQQAAIERYCVERGLTLTRWYIDDAISGTSTVGRRGFQKLVEDARSPTRDFTRIVCYDVKRFGRVDNDEAGYYRHLLRQHGVQVLYASENFSGDGTDDLLRPVKQWQAREESKDLSKVTIRGLLTKSQTGHWMGGSPPYGYDLEYRSQKGEFLARLRYNADGTKTSLTEEGKVIRVLARGASLAVSKTDHCRLVLGDPARVDVVRRIFRMYVEEARGYHSIASLLNRDGVPSSRNAEWSARCSGRWAMTAVRSILVNPAYCGDTAWNRRTDARFFRISGGSAVTRDDVHGRRLEPNDPSDWIVVRDTHPGIVPRRTWEKAQRLLAGKAASATQRGVNPRTGVTVTEPHVPTHGAVSGPRARFLLSGLCVCSACASRYEGYTLRSHGTREDGTRDQWRHYACGAGIRLGPSVCRLGLVRQDALEPAVTEAVLRHYQRFMGKGGARTLKRVAAETLGMKRGTLEREHARASERLAEIDETVANLLDHMTSRTKAAVERRLEALGNERDDLASRVESLARELQDQEAMQGAVREVRKFIGTLREVLESAPLIDRHAALRRCVGKVTVDFEKQAAAIELATIPSVLWRLDRDGSETVTVALPALKRAGTRA